LIESTTANYSGLQTVRGRIEEKRIGEREKRGERKGPAAAASGLASARA